MRDTTGFLYEIGLLERFKRTGWATAGVPNPESVADCVSIIAALIAAMEHVDPQRAAFLDLWHSWREPRTTAASDFGARCMILTDYGDKILKHTRPPRSCRDVGDGFMGADQRCGGR